MPELPQYTGDHVEIIPGLWVWDNNLDSVQVDPAQFDNPSPMTGVGGTHWDGWFNTLRLDGSRGPILNGERMATVFEGKPADQWQGRPFRDTKTN